jgi:hypothetical protein
MLLSSSNGSKIACAKEFTQTVRMLHDIHEADASSACVMVVPICNLTRKPSHMLADCRP